MNFFVIIFLWQHILYLHTLFLVQNGFSVLDGIDAVKVMAAQQADMPP